MSEMLGNHIGICQNFETLVEFSKKVMDSATTSLYFLHVNKDEKDLGKKRKSSHSNYGFLANDWLKILLEKNYQRGGAGHKRGRVWGEEEWETRKECEQLSLPILFYVVFIFLITLNLVPYGVLFYMYRSKF